MARLLKLCVYPYLIIDLYEVIIESVKVLADSLELLTFA